MRNTAALLPESARMLHPTLMFPVAVSQGPCDIVPQSGVHFILPFWQTDQHRGNKSREMPNLCYQPIIRPHGALGDHRYSASNRGLLVATSTECRSCEPSVVTGTECRPHEPSGVTGTACRSRGPSVVTGTVHRPHGPSVVKGIMCRPRGPLSGHRFRVQTMWTLSSHRYTTQTMWTPQWSRVQCKPLKAAGLRYFPQGRKEEV